jgi:hypothetical protein
MGPVVRDLDRVADRRAGRGHRLSVVLADRQIGALEDRRVEQQPHAVAVLARHCEVVLAVLVEIADGQRHGPPADTELDARQEQSVSVAGENGDRFRLGVRDRQVLERVPVEVPDRDARGPLPDQEARRRAERALAIPQQDRDPVRAAVRHRQVLMTVLVEVAQREGAGLR